MACRSISSSRGTTRCKGTGCRVCASLSSRIIAIRSRNELRQRSALSMPPTDLEVLMSTVAVAHEASTAARGSSAPNFPSTIRTGDLAVHLNTRVVSVNDQPVHLTGKEYGILELLSLRKGTMVTKEMFLNHSMAGWTSPSLKSSMSLFASFAKSSPRRRVANTISRPYGAAATSCAT